ncbi:MAG TPA: tetratricopeptide repeat protein [Mycobacteriales bacterium]|nr:tetratricopeptide repeat protein [Mycobacteriales bacterium]
MEPGQPQSLDEFITRLRALKVWAGNPSITQITRSVADAWRQAGRPESELPARATVGYCFRTGRTRPNPDLLLAIVAVLAGADRRLVERWRHALRVVLGEAEAANQVSVAELPADLVEFTGRSELLDRAAGGDDPLVISALDGMAGVGKTTLAVRLAHRLADRGVVDRVLFVNLRGYDPDSPPANPAAVLESFLRRLGVPGERVPSGLDRRAALYREVLAGTRTLILLDNAASSEQVSPLLPAVPGCPVVITSRVALADLPGARQLWLPPFTPAEALDLLRRIAGAGRVDADPATAARVAELLGHLPLALAVIGCHLRDHPDWVLADYPPALTALALEGGVRAALALSDAGLAPAPRRLLRVLALHPGADIDRCAAAALADQDLATTAAQLAALTAANLLQEKTPGRYDFHDLVRAYAIERANLDHPHSHLAAALDRLFVHYGHTAALAMDAAYRYEASQRPVPPPAATPAPDVGAPAAAEAWLDAELDNLLATAAAAPDHGRPEHTVRQSAVLHRHLRTRGRYADAISLHQHVLRLTRAGGDRSAEQRVLSLLGDVHYMRGRYDAAAESYQRALTIARDIGDRNGEQNALNGLGGVGYMQGRYGPAAESYQQALVIARDRGDRTAEQNALNGLGWVHHVQGRRRLAIGYYEQGLAIARETGNPNGEQNALNGLGGVYQADGRHEQAGRCYEQVLRSARATGNRLGQQNALTGLGHSRYAQGRYDEAADLFGQVLRIAQDTGNRIGEALALTGLSHVRYQRGEYGPAIRQYEQVLAIAQAGGYRNVEFEAYAGLGRCHTATGDYDEALRCHQIALELATELGQPDDQARAHDGLAHVQQGLGQPESARAHWRQALDLMTGHDLDHTYDPQVTAAAIRAHLTD